MDASNAVQYQDWVAQEWAGEDPPRDREAAVHWTKDEWVGDQGHGPRTVRRSAALMVEGERGLSGFRHTVSAAHWAPSH